jgi:undecaprenyl phosphate N,N'-diacetylbacillosamine 1-phosphate transferase
MRNSFFKRCFDLSIALLLILVLLPLFLIIAIVIKLESSGMIFFVQKRVGKDFKPINVLKFRTMTNEMREVKPVIGKAEGVTYSGYILRRFKIDELPQLINVLKGEMSLIGPRPSIYSQLDNMTNEQKIRYSIKPGLTGLAQVSGNIHIPWVQRYKYDLYYVQNVSFSLDIKILIRTVLIVLKGEEKFVEFPLVKIDETI